MWKETKQNVERNGKDEENDKMWTETVKMWKETKM